MAAEPQNEGLHQALKQRHMTLISIGGTIGAGLFVGSGVVINSTGPGALLSFLLAGVLVMLVMRMLGEMAVARDKTPLGAAQRALRRASLMFARPWQVPPGWLTQQFGLAQQPNFTETTRQSLRQAVSLGGQREVFLDRLPGLRMPTLLLWGVEDRVIPYWQATAAAALLEKGTLGPIPNCGHLPHV